MRYRLNSDGTKTPIAGRGRAEYGASTVRTGTVTNVAVSVESTAVANITFTTAMPDANYLVNISECNYGIPTFSITEKTKTGFKVVIYNPTTITLSDLSFNYTAFKLYTNTEYNGLLNNQRYSTSEIDTGKTWIDGKTIYRKVVDCGNLPNATTKDVAHGITGIDTVVSIYGMASNKSLNTHFPLPYSNTTPTDSVVILVIGANIHIVDAYNFSGYTAKVVLEYTKS